MESGIYEGHVWGQGPKGPFGKRALRTSYDIYYYMYKLIVSYYWCSVQIENI